MPDLFNMTDIETMSTEPNAAIVSIASVNFDPRVINTEEEMRELDFFEITIDLKDNDNYGRDISESTQAWWAQQSKEAQAALHEGEQATLPTALQKFGLWITNSYPRPTLAFANGPEFDHTIMQSACRATNVMWPFKYWDSQSVRTVKELAWPEGDMPDVSIGTAHNALDDVFKQIRLVQYGYAKLGC